MADSDAMSFRPSAAFRLKAFLVLSAMAGGAWWRAASSDGWGAALVTFIAALGTAVAVFAAYQFADPRPLVRLDDAGVRFTGGARCAWGRSRIYGWDEVKEVSAVASEYPAVLEHSRIRLIPDVQVRRGKQAATSAFWVRTADGRRFKVWSASRDASLGDFQEVMQRALKKWRRGTVSRS